MLKIHDAVRQILFDDEVALISLSLGYLNLSAYAKKVEGEVEKMTKKDVGVPSIVVSLSRIGSELGNVNPLIQDIEIENVTTKSPLSEIVFPKSPRFLSKLSSLYEEVKTTGADFLTMTLSTNEITVICSDRIKEAVIRHFGCKPTMDISGLASVGLSLDPKYYPMPNITYSLIRRIAVKRIALAETITSHTEIIFVLSQKYLAEIVGLFDVTGQAISSVD